ncbi:hypothetical protein Lal_00034030 [Lupinus albus]|nr:hypothetical protein Lal_00034030 [Lupinus albus]
MGVVDEVHDYHIVVSEVCDSLTGVVYEQCDFRIIIKVVFCSHDFLAGVVISVHDLRESYVRSVSPMYLYISPTIQTKSQLGGGTKLKMVIIRDIVNDFSDENDIELCCDDNNSLEISSSERVNITYGNRDNYVVNGFPDVQPLYHYSKYMQWYLQRTRKYISPDRAYSSGSYNFIKSSRDQYAPPNVHHNPMQIINDVYLQCNEMMEAFAKLLSSAFSNNNYQAPSTHHFDMPIAPEFPQHYESQTQMDTHPQTFTQTPVPQQQHLFRFQSFGAMTDYYIPHQFASSSNFQGMLPFMFGTTSTTPLSAFHSQQYYQPTMPTQVQQSNIYDDEDDEDDEDEEEPQLVRGGTRQPIQPQLRVQPP